MSTKQDLFYSGIPPETTGAYIVQSFVTDNSAANNRDWITPLGTDAPKGPCWVELQASGNDCFVRFKSSNAAAGTTITNGIRLGKLDKPTSFFLDPVKHAFIDVISTTGAGTLQVHMVSVIHQRNTQ